MTTAKTLREELIEAGVMQPPPTSKRCSHCRLRKPMGDFPPNRHVKSGRSSWCRVCHYEATRQWKAKRKPK